MIEDIFYAVLALHVAGKTIDKENIRALLKAAGASVDESALNAMAAFVESLECARRQKKERTVDPRIIQFITSELVQHKAQIKQMESLLEVLNKSAPPISQSDSIGSEFDEKLHLYAVNEKEGCESESEMVSEVPRKEADVETEERGRYVYGIVANKEMVILGEIGIGGKEVYTIPYRGICAIVHNCPPEPYQSQDDETVKCWVKIHQGVLDEAKSRFGTIIPLGFDTIFQPKDDHTSPDQVVQDWLKENYDRLNALLDKMKDKDEYGVQIFYDPRIISEVIAQQSEEIKKIKEEMASKSPGLAYMYKQKLERAVKAEMERLAEKWFKDFYTNIKKYADDIVVEKTKKAEKGKVMLLNLSCLVSTVKVKALGEELDRIDNMEGFSVRFTGPWPPYSFVVRLTAENV